MRRVTFLIVRPLSFPKYFSFRENLMYEEDSLYRNIDPALAFKLEMHRFAEYNLQPCHAKNAQFYIFFATGKNAPADRRFFVRTILRHSDRADNEVTEEFMLSSGEHLLFEALNELELNYNKKEFGGTDCNHIFINLNPTVQTDLKLFPKYIQNMHNMVLRHGDRLWGLRVLEAEIKARFRFRGDKELRVARFIISNISGQQLKIHLYEETISASSGFAVYRSFLSKRPGPMHMLPVSTPYPTKGPNQSKRYTAQKIGTTYAYDLCDLISEAIEARWDALSENAPAIKPPALCATWVELVLDDNNDLRETTRAPGLNDIAMVAWKGTLFTPEAPQGRDIVLIANDLTCVIGSFGPQEDVLFFKASQLARKLGIPRIYMAANSGARIGLAEELIPKFKVAWNNESMPWHGFKYLYLSPEDYRSLSDSVTATLVEESGEKRYIITDVLGIKDGLGVENLRGSGQIAGETSLAYDEIFTLTLVSCRSVGIGAYLVRLGQRTIQTVKSHIILTGADALNKVLGRDVYTSNQQLGGPQIMYNNGVSHLRVKDDLEALRAAIHWLSYVPAKRGARLPIMPQGILDAKGKFYAVDPVDREPTFTPSSQAYNPRHMIAGSYSSVNTKEWQSGLFDRGSWTETLGGWGNTVVVGRARLGGIPVGIVSVETNCVEGFFSVFRTSMLHSLYVFAVVIPADPANIHSTAQTVMQAGQVWFPDSSYKTAQSIRDFNNEGLPLFILANWRGFSGGMRDMYEEVRQFVKEYYSRLHTYTVI